MFQMFYSLNNLLDSVDLHSTLYSFKFSTLFLAWRACKAPLNFFFFKIPAGNFVAQSDDYFSVHHHRHHRQSRIIDIAILIHHHHRKILTLRHTLSSC